MSWCPVSVAVAATVPLFLPLSQWLCCYCLRPSNKTWAMWPVVPVPLPFVLPLPPARAPTIAFRWIEGRMCECVCVCLPYAAYAWHQFNCNFTWELANSRRACLCGVVWCKKSYKNQIYKMLTLISFLIYEPAVRRANGCRRGSGQWA